MTHTEEIMAAVFILDRMMELARAPLVKEAWGGATLPAALVFSPTFGKGQGSKPMMLLCSFGLRAVLLGRVCS